jgi:plasmid stabilization system protein ParE
MKIRLSSLAHFRLVNLLSDLESEWGSTARKRFLTKLEKSVFAISKFPKAFPESRYKGIRKCVVTHQTTLFYRIKSNQVEIITVFDNRQNPERLRDDLRKKFR